MLIVKKKKTMRERLDEVDEKIALTWGGGEKSKSTRVGHLPSHTSTQKGITTSSYYQITPVKNGHYKVTIDLSKWLSQHDLLSFTREFQRICSQDKDFENLCSLHGSLLQYTSESLFPEQYDHGKEKVMIILGNPATHSVAGGMFFYSKSDGNRHQFWGKLEEAGLMPRIRYCTRTEEAKERKKCIVDGVTSHKYFWFIRLKRTLPHEWP